MELKRSDGSVRCCQMLPNDLRCCQVLPAQMLPNAARWLQKSSNRAIKFWRCVGFLIFYSIPMGFWGLIVLKWLIKDPRHIALLLKLISRTSKVFTFYGPVAPRIYHDNTSNQIQAIHGNILKTYNFLSEAS